MITPSIDEILAFYATRAGDFAPAVRLDALRVLVAERDANRDRVAELEDALNRSICLTNDAIGHLARINRQGIPDHAVAMTTRTGPI